MQTKQELEKHYSAPDPWGVEKNDDDHTRRFYLSELALLHLPSWPKVCERAIDICCGEGFVSGVLPAKEIHGIELSDNAATRLPESVTRVSAPVGKYDLVTCFGALYGHYNWRQMLDWIWEASAPGTTIMVSGVRAWEMPSVVDELSRKAKQVFLAEFPYNPPGEGHYQRVRIFRV